MVLTGKIYYCPQAFSDYSLGLLKFHRTTTARRKRRVPRKGAPQGTLVTSSVGFGAKGKCEGPLFKNY